LVISTASGPTATQPIVGVGVGVRFLAARREVKVKVGVAVGVCVRVGVAVGLFVGEKVGV
jgi:hypothetical protein